MIPETITQKYFSISQVANELNVRQSNVRFWCKSFDINPERRHKIRKFTRSEVEILRQIKHHHDTGLFTLAGIKCMLGR